jgi:hypothetical protein
LHMRLFSPPQRMQWSSMEQYSASLALDRTLLLLRKPLACHNPRLQVNQMLSVECALKCAKYMCTSIISSSSSILQRCRFKIPMVCSSRSRCDDHGNAQCVPVKHARVRVGKNGCSRGANYDVAGAELVPDRHQCIAGTRLGYHKPDFDHQVIVSHELHSPCQILRQALYNSN